MTTRTTMTPITRLDREEETVQNQHTMMSTKRKKEEKKTTTSSDGIRSGGRGRRSLHAGRCWVQKHCIILLMVDGHFWNP